ncbi:unnamed protein product, partial [Mesorhabditis belari]|uniref:Solute carrier family 25 member 44 n=1 Tax=Mesorhabditis belari TaxID=2138241 RepID=A0AAF3EUS7_9BILA
MASSDADYGAEETMTKSKLLVIEWEHLNLWRFYPMAIASSWTIRCLLYPMSVVKSRLQLQKQDNVYRGMRHAFVEIVRQEGFTALYRGFWMTLPQISASFLYSSTYERMRDLLQVHLDVTNPSLVSALAGAIASPCAQMVFVPTDIVAQHMMVYNQAKKFAGSSKGGAVHDFLQLDGLEKRQTLGIRVIRAVYKVDGFRGFYRGFLSAILLYIPSTMVFWSTYYKALDVFRSLRASFFTSIDANAIQKEKLYIDQALAGSIGGVMAAIMTNPLEMLRIRLQVHRTSYTETLRRLWKFEGTRVFSKGLAPRVLNNALYSMLIMLGYETVKKTCVLPEYKDKVVW